MTDHSHWVSANGLYILTLAVLALLALLVGASLLFSLLREKRTRVRIEQALQRKAGKPDTSSYYAGPDQVVNGDPRFGSILDRAAVLGLKWGDGRFGDVLLEDEDRRLLDMGGYASYSRARALFLFSRGVLALGLPALALLVLPSDAFIDSAVLTWLLYGVLGFGLGWMLPKWVVAHRFGERKRAAHEELPLLIDLLRLLQGVGLSIDQSLHVIETEFKDVLPVLGYEIGISTEQYRRGRPRLHSMSRMISGFGNEDLEMVCRLVAQVDEHGGAVQDPLLSFSARLREQRRIEIKQKIGKLTVKMTGVMVMTLLPALLVVTAGSGFISVMRSLQQAGGG